MLIVLRALVWGVRLPANSYGHRLPSGSTPTKKGGNHWHSVHDSATAVGWKPGLALSAAPRGGLHHGIEVIDHFSDAPSLPSGLTLPHEYSSLCNMSNPVEAGAIKPSPRDFVEFIKLIGCASLKHCARLVPP